MSVLPPQNFEFITTEDGSPSVLMGNAEGVEERMHHFRGAFTESVYIYLKAIDVALAAGLPPHFLSLGLGLGYNEILVAGALLRHHADLTSGRLDSYETEPFLKLSLRHWLLEDEGVYPAARIAYDKILGLTSAHFGIQPESIKSLLASWLKTDQWQMRGAFSANCDGRSPYSCLLYDAFSAKMSPDLWSEVALGQILDRFTSGPCVFSTYAATGALKRSLRSRGFVVQKRTGFGGKKESTLATREISPPPEQI